MPNPILQNQQPQPGRPTQPQAQTQPQQSFGDFVSTIQNPQAFAQNLLQQNPAARQFMSNMQKQPMNARNMAFNMAKQKGIDPNQLQSIHDRLISH